MQTQEAGEEAAGPATRMHNNYCGIPGPYELGQCVLDLPGFTRRQRKLKREEMGGHQW